MPTWIFDRERYADLRTRHSRRAAAHLAIDIRFELAVAAIIGIILSRII